MTISQKRKEKKEKAFIIMEDADGKARLFGKIWVVKAQKIFFQKPEAPALSFPDGPSYFYFSLWLYWCTKECSS
jgi:hypothetical protein